MRRCNLCARLRGVCSCSEILSRLSSCFSLCRRFSIGALLLSKMIMLVQEILPFRLHHRQPSNHLHRDRISVPKETRRAPDVLVTNVTKCQDQTYTLSFGAARPYSTNHTLLHTPIHEESPSPCLSLIFLYHRTFETNTAPAPGTLSPAVSVELLVALDFVRRLSSSLA